MATLAQFANTFILALPFFWIALEFHLIRTGKKTLVPPRNKPRQFRAR